MDLISYEGSLEHNKKSKIEGPYRIRKAIKTAKKPKLELKQEYLKPVYSQDYINKVKRKCESNERLAEVQLSPTTFKASLASAELAIKASENNQFALTRPPGHHATQNQAMGFCLFNNIAIATKKILEKENKKILIIDFDGHYGNGTVNILQNEENIFYLSISQKNSYPTTNKTYYKTQNNQPHLLNLEIPKKSGDDLIKEITPLLKEKIKNFNPNIIGVSAGFDSYKKDKLLQLNLTENTYHYIGKQLSRITDEVFTVLEGGYHNRILECINSFRQGIKQEKLSKEYEKTTTNKNKIRETKNRLQKILNQK